MKKKQDKSLNLDFDLLGNLQEKAAKKRQRNKRRQFIAILLGILVLFLLLSYLYFLFFGENGQIKNIKISNNQFFLESEVLAKAEINYQENFYFLNTKKYEKRFAAWQICQVKVYKRANQILEIVFENADLLAYYSDKNNQLYLLDANNRSYPYSNEYFEALKFLPYLIEHNEEERRLLVAGLKMVERAVIYQISEISHHATSFDENMLKLTMEDGITIFLDFPALTMLNSYNKIVAPLLPSNRCLFFDGASGSVIATNCLEDQ